jgi:hypothetical protein
VQLAWPYGQRCSTKFLSVCEREWGIFLQQELMLLHRTVERAFLASDDRFLTDTEDYQGIGGPNKPTQPPADGCGV